jgi:superfamily I DNA and/or RNA helicase
MTSVTQYKTLILIKDKATNEYVDKTSEISSYEKTRTGYTVVFRSNSKPYNFNFDKISVYGSPKVVKTDGAVVTIDLNAVENIDIMIEFDSYLKIFYKNKKTELHKKSTVKIEYSCLEEPRVQELKKYLVAISNCANRSDGQDSFLSRELESIAFISDETVFADYSLGKTIEPVISKDVLVFPFGLNKSQKIAVEKAMTNKITIIKGPPGTGKTQTILNIIANVVHQNMNVAVVSGNNSATQNVYEKLEKNGYGFLAAPLGNKENQKTFFDGIELGKKDLSKWAQSEHKLDGLKKQSVESLKYLNQQLELINERARIKEQLSKLKLEQKHYLSANSESDFNVKKVVPIDKWTSETLLKFIATLESLSMTGEKVRFLDRVKLLFDFRFTKVNLDESNMRLLVLKLHQHYYEKAIHECIERLKAIKLELKSGNFEKLMVDYQKQSELLMQNALYEQYHDMKVVNFDSKSFLSDFGSFIKQYPVILSTTHSIRRNIPEGRSFDYLIIDEASQVDLVTATIAMSCCKHIVIVGDPMQLPHIVDANVQMLNNVYMDQYHITPEYDYAAYSIIESLVQVFGDRIPVTMLQEHYRCHPQIIRFCNEKYYDNNLVIMTEDWDEDDVLSIVKTAPGNHERQHPDGGFINVRQMEVIRDDVLPTLDFETKDIGIVTPYRQQANETKLLIGETDILVETVHKFQGREKDVIIISTVRSVPDEFVDDKKMINVAVSRAVKKLIVIVGSDFKALHGSNIGDLIKYIEYAGNGDNVKQSQKVSIFDCLYSDYEKSLIPLMRKKLNVSAYESENLMATLIASVLKMDQFNAMKVVMHVSLNYLIKDQSPFEGREKAYLNHPFTHVDFVIFSKLNKEPILVVEVDGYKYHKKGTDQFDRDRLKDGILAKAGIKMVRFMTNGSSEKERLVAALSQGVNE